jgi:hypothetical protein
LVGQEGGSAGVLPDLSGLVGQEGGSAGVP